MWFHLITIFLLINPYNRLFIIVYDFTSTRYRFILFFLFSFFIFLSRFSSYKLFISLCFTVIIRRYYVVYRIMFNRKKKKEKNNNRFFFWKKLVGFVNIQHKKERKKQPWKIIITNRECRYIQLKLFITFRFNYLWFQNNQ